MTAGESSPKVDQKYVQSELTAKKKLKIRHEKAPSTVPSAPETNWEYRSGVIISFVFDKVVVVSSHSVPQLRGSLTANPQSPLGH